MCSGLRLAQRFAIFFGSDVSECRLLLLLCFMPCKNQRQVARACTLALSNYAVFFLRVFFCLNSTHVPNYLEIQRIKTSSKALTLQINPLHRTENVDPFCPLPDPCVKFPALWYLCIHVCVDLLYTGTWLPVPPKCSHTFLECSQCSLKKQTQGDSRFFCQISAEAMHFFLITFST